MAKLEFVVNIDADAVPVADDKEADSVVRFVSGGVGILCVWLDKGGGAKPALIDSFKFSDDMEGRDDTSAVAGGWSVSGEVGYPYSGGSSSWLSRGAIFWWRTLLPFVWPVNILLMSRNCGRMPLLCARVRVL